MVPHHRRFPPFPKSEPSNTLTPSPRTQVPGAELENPRLPPFSRLKGRGTAGVLEPGAAAEPQDRNRDSRRAGTGQQLVPPPGGGREAGPSAPPESSAPSRDAPAGCELLAAPRRSVRPGSGSADDRTAPAPRPLPGPRRAQRPPAPPTRPPLTFLGSGFAARRACSFSTTWSADSAAIAVTGAASSPELGSRRVLGPQLRPPCGPGGDGSANGPFRASAGGRVGTASGPAPEPDHAHSASAVRPAAARAAGHAPDSPARSRAASHAPDALGPARALDSASPALAFTPTHRLPRSAASHTLVYT